MGNVPKYCKRLKRVQTADAKVNTQMALLFSNVGVIRSADFASSSYCPVADNAG
jgi:hypothetical protein